MIDINTQAIQERITSVNTRGMLWGEETARDYEMEPEVKQLIEINIQEKKNVANELLTERYLDYVCLGPADGDCMELPTEKVIRNTYDTEDERFRNMPVYAFESGFLDEFVTITKINR